MGYTQTTIPFDKDNFYTHIVSGQTTTYPKLKRNNKELYIKLADDNDEKSEKDIIENRFIALMKEEDNNE